MKQRAQGNVYTVIRGKVIGNFHPGFRAEKEGLASAEGLTFDEYMVRDMRRSLASMLAAI
jgi:hypothetical protein